MKNKIKENVLVSKVMREYGDYREIKGRKQALEEVEKIIDDFDITTCIDVEWYKKGWQKELKEQIKKEMKG